MTVDGEQISQLIAQIPVTYAELAAGLSNMVRQFDYDKIMTLCAGLEITE